MCGKESITVDVDKIRSDMKDGCLGAYFGGGFGGPRKSKGGQKRGFRKPLGRRRLR